MVSKRQIEKWLDKDFKGLLPDELSTDRFEKRYKRKDCKHKTGKNNGEEIMKKYKNEKLENTLLLILLRLQRFI